MKKKFKKVIHTKKTSLKQVHNMVHNLDIRNGTDYKCSITIGVLASECSRFFIHSSLKDCRSAYTWNELLFVYEEIMKED